MPALIWALQLHIVEILSTVWFSLAQWREAWLSTPNGYLSYFSVNLIIAACLFVLAALELISSLRPPRDTANSLASMVLLVFILGFGFRLYFLGSHHLSHEWYAEATSDEPFDRRSYFIGLVVGPLRA